MDGSGSTQRTGTNPPEPVSGTIPMDGPETKVTRVVIRAVVLAQAYKEAYETAVLATHDSGPAHFAALKAMELAERTIYGA